MRKRRHTHSTIEGEPADRGIAGREEHRRHLRRPIGLVSIIHRLIGSEQIGRLDVLVTNVSEGGIGLRCPIGLVKGGVYSLHMGTHAGANVSYIRVVRSRRREDGTFDVGAKYTSAPPEQRTRNGPT